MKTTKHWLHLILTLLTFGIWSMVWLFLVATRELHNRGYKLGKAAGRVELSNERERESRVPKHQWVHPGDDLVNCRCTVVTPGGVEIAPPTVTVGKVPNYPKGVDPFAPITSYSHTQAYKSRLTRFSELADKRTSGLGLSNSEFDEYVTLKGEFVK